MSEGAFRKRWSADKRDALRELSEINLFSTLVFILFGVGLVVIAPSAAKGYAIAGAIALVIAFVAYPWQKNKDRELKVDEEKRRAIGELIHAVERHMAVIKEANRVSVDQVPSADEERVSAQLALSLVRAYGCEAIVLATIEYDKAIRNFARKLEAEKPLRQTCGINSNTGRLKRSPEYIEAQEARNLAWKRLTCTREVLFTKFSDELGIRVPAGDLELENEKQEVAQ